MSFKKKPSISTSSPVRSSDRRKLCATIAESYGLPADVAKTLLPEGTLSAKYTTHLDIPGILYLSPPALGLNPLFFTLGKGSLDLIPTVYTLHARPDLLPAVTTHPHVILRLTSGADLMAPGLTANPVSDESVKKGDLVAIVATGCPTPLGVGVLAVERGSELKAGDVRRRGKAVEMLHSWQDYLWQFGKTPIDVGFSIPDGDEYESDSEDEPAANPPPKGKGKAAKDNKSELPAVEKLKVADEPAAPSQTLEPKEVDTVLRLALLQYISSLPKPIPPGTFPIPASTFYSTHILASRPYWAPADQAVIAKSTYKKLAKFLKAMEKEGLIKTKSNRDQESIVSVDQAHPAVREHKPVGTSGEVEAREKKKAAAAGEGGVSSSGGAGPSGGAAAGGAGAGGAGAGGKGKGRVMDVKEVWKPHGASLAFWSEIDESNDTYYLASDIRTHFLSYVKAHKLVHPRDPAFVLLDPVLRAAVLKKGEDVSFLKRDEAIDRLRASMQGWFTLQVEGQEIVRKKGSPSHIRISLKKRQAKHVTLISGLESWDIDPKGLAEDLKQKCASSSGVAPLPSASPKSPLVEVLVQGTHDKVVVEMLVARGIPKKFLDVVR